MNVEYKSSKFATYSQYFASPVIVAIFLFQIYYFFIAGHAIDEESLFMLPFWTWASIVVIINVTKLRYVKVSEDSILMKTLISEKTLEYKDIEWINQNIFGSNWYILTIKYKNNETGKSNIIFVLPEMYTSRERLFSFSELNITKYIREQVIKVKPEYRIENEPSRWALAKWMFLSLIPLFLISFLLIK
ncbi:MAG TPA: hypothetical protein VIK86_05805 [Candidatus Paceibacterota bacterium]